MLKFSHEYYTNLQPAEKGWCKKYTHLFETENGTASMQMNMSIVYLCSYMLKAEDGWPLEVYEQYTFFIVHTCDHEHWVYFTNFFEAEDGNSAHMTRNTPTHLKLWILTFAKIVLHS